LAGPDRPLTLLESARVFGGLRHLELELFTQLGRRAPEAQSPSVTVWASSASMAAAWRASLLEGLLPFSKGLPGLEESTRSAGPLTDAVLGRLEAAATDETLAAFVAGELYPALLAAYGSRGDGLAPAADEPVRLALSRLTADLSYQLTSVKGLLEPPGSGA
jgi:hypothetical protein